MYVLLGYIGIQPPILLCNGESCKGIVWELLKKDAYISKGGVAQGRKPIKG